MNKSLLVIICVLVSLSTSANAGVEWMGLDLTGDQYISDVVVNPDNALTRSARDTQAGRVNASSCGSVARHSRTLLIIHFCYVVTDRVIEVIAF